MRILYDVNAFVPIFVIILFSFVVDTLLFGWEMWVSSSFGYYYLFVVCSKISVVVDIILYYNYRLLWMAYLRTHSLSYTLSLINRYVNIEFFIRFFFFFCIF